MADNTTKRAEDIVVGDELMGLNGFATVVQGVALSNETVYCIGLMITTPFASFWKLYVVIHGE